jgi:hypothetical protein
MAKKGKTKPATEPKPQASVTRPGKPSALLDTRVVYCGDNLEQLAKLHCVKGLAAFQSIGIEVTR